MQENENSLEKKEQEKIIDLSAIYYVIWAASCEKGPDDIFCPYVEMIVCFHYHK